MIAYEISLKNYLNAPYVIKDKLIKFISPEIIDFISKYTDIDSTSVKILETSSRLNIESINDKRVKHIVNIKRINDIRYMNKFFESINATLEKEGLFIGCVETIDERRKRILGKRMKLFSYPHYAIDFTIKRVFPKWVVTKKLYFFLTRGLNRVLSLPETLGRLISCGFEIVDIKEMNNLTYFVARKIKKPVYDMQPSFGPLFRMRRVGKDGKIIHVYKMRTMHPYAEYLQEYVYKNNSLQEGGKFKDDFRITKWGKIFRKLWIDELPMLLNWVKGDLKLVGVRPLSSHYMSLYTEDLRERRKKYKPGLVPPYYADLPKSLEEIMASESKYLDAYEKSPFVTDVKYFFKAWYNIIVKRARSG